MKNNEDVWVALLVSSVILVGLTMGWGWGVLLGSIYLTFFGRYFWG